MTEAVTQSRGSADIGRIVGASFRIYRLRWRPHLLAAMIAQLPVLLPTLILVTMLLKATVNLLMTRTLEALLPAVTLALALLFLSFVSAFFFVLMSGAAAELVERWLNAEHVSLLSAYRLALRRFAQLALALLAAFAIVVGALFGIGAFLALIYMGFIALGIDIAGDPRVFWTMLVASAVSALVAGWVLLDALVKWSVFVQAVIIENTGPLQALRRSAELVRGNWFRAAGAMALFVFVPTVLMSVLASLLNVLFIPFHTAGLASPDLTNSIAIAIAQIVFSPVPAIGVTVLFYRLRDGQRVWGRIDARVAADRES